MMACDVVILGAGPYGLAAGAHLRNIQGLDVRVFGEPMEFWKAHMPEGMLLRSPWAASHISDPQPRSRWTRLAIISAFEFPRRFRSIDSSSTASGFSAKPSRRSIAVESPASREMPRLPYNSQRWRAIAVAPGRNRRGNRVVCPPATAV